MSKQALHPLTQAINKKQQAKSKQSRLEAKQWLAKTFPSAFDDTLSIHPLKTGILQDILDHADSAAAVGISKSKLREALVAYTRRIDYLTCLKAREMRIDLEGNPTVLVTEEEAAQAAEKIKKHIEKSAKIARQNASLPSKKSGTVPSIQLTQESDTYSSDMDFDHRFAANTSPNRTTTAVIIKNKSSKAFDPEAVARLKEKLGLSRQL
jgi:ProP effector